MLYGNRFKGDTLIKLQLHMGSKGSKFDNYPGLIQLKDKKGSAKDYLFKPFLFFSAVKKRMLVKQECRCVGCTGTLSNRA